MNEKVLQSYKSTPYISRPFKYSSIHRLEAICELLGIKNQKTSSARVLEIGCAFGGNLLYQALNYTNSSFYGIDISKEQIDKAKEISRLCRAKNLHFICADICDILASDEMIQSLGKFDYIIAHGVFSWVDDSTKIALLKLGKTLLNSSGVFYISYNTYPGWKTRDILRDLMLFSTSHLSKDDEKLARSKSVIRSLLSFAKQNPKPFSEDFFEHAQGICEFYDDFYLMHEHFELSNDPKYLHEFVEIARQNGLFYLCDSMLSPSFISAQNTPLRLPNIKERIKAEQYADFLLLRAFRASILATSLPSNPALIGKFANLGSVFFRGCFEIKDNEIKAKNAEIILDKSAAKLAEVFNSFYPSFASLEELFLAFKKDNNSELPSFVANCSELMLIGALEISKEKLKALSYKVGKTRLKSSFYHYFSYFASTKDPLIAPAGALGDMLSLDRSCASLALFFDGKRDYMDILRDFKPLVNSFKSDEALLDFIKDFQNLLWQNFLFEEFDAKL